MTYIIIGLLFRSNLHGENYVIRKVWLFIIIRKLDKIHLDTPTCQNAKIVKPAASDGAQGIPVPRETLPQEEL